MLGCENGLEKLGNDNRIGLGKGRSRGEGRACRE